MWRKAETLSDALTRSHRSLVCNSLLFYVGYTYEITQEGAAPVLCTLKSINHLSDRPLKVVIHSGEGTYEHNISPESITHARYVPDIAEAARAVAKEYADSCLASAA